MAFDGIVTKAITSELSQLAGARIDKTFLRMGRAEANL